MIVWFSGNGHLWQHTLILDAAPYQRGYSIPQNSEVGATPLLRADRGIVARTHGGELSSRRDKRALSMNFSVEVQFWPALCVRRDFPYSDARAETSRLGLSAAYPLSFAAKFSRALRAHVLFRRVYSNDPRIKRRI